MQQIIPYNPKLKSRAKELRNNSTKAEVALWMGLKGRKVLGLQFYRQRMIGNYIVDFYCKKLKLAIEVDDISHDMKSDYDERRTEILQRFGVTMLRVTNKDVFADPDGVVEYIRQYIVAKTPSP